VKITSIRGLSAVVSDVDDVDASAPLEIDVSRVTYHPSRSGSLVSGAPTYTSSIDSSITGLTYSFVYDAGVAAAAAATGVKMALCIGLHGYNGASSNISDAERQETVDVGLISVTPLLRGHSGGAGVSDDSVRELYDILDVIAHFVANHPTICDGTRVIVYGYSGGGANAIALAAKYPGRFIAFISMFGFGDYGVSSLSSLWAVGLAYRPTVEARIGLRGSFPSEAQLLPYRARNPLTNLGQSMLLQSAVLYLLWHVSDTIGALQADVVEALEAAKVPTSRWAYEADAATVDATVTVANSTFTSVGHGLPNGRRVFVSSTAGLSSVPAPLSAVTPYRVANRTANTFQLVPLESDSVIALTSAGAGTLKVSDQRWIHGYLNAPSTQVIEGSRIAQHYRNALAPSVADVGEIVVTGYLVHPRFEVWLDDPATTNPRVNGTGGRKHVAHIRFNALSGEYLVTPLSGACKVCVRQGGIDVLREVSAPTLFDTVNRRPAFADLIADITHEWGGIDPAKQNLYSGALSDTWTSTTGGLSLTRDGAIAGHLIAADDGDGKQSVRQAGGTCLKGALPVTGDFGVAVIFRRYSGAATCVLFGLGDDAESVSQSLHLEVVGATSVRGYYVNAAGTDNPIATVAGDTLTTWHVAMMSRSGMDVTVQVDGGNPVTATIPGTLNVLTRVNALSVNRAAALFTGDQAAVRAIALRAGSAWSVAERAAIARFFTDQRAWFGT
jgi:pimeloyl-ACP methyl ester carboxylesterase